MSRIIVIGSLNMDLTLHTSKLPDRGETVIAESSRLCPGGKGANQAVAAARLGASVTMLGSVGIDGNGDLMLAALKSDGVDVSHVVRDRDVSTGMALITVEQGGMNTIVVEPGANGRYTPQLVEQAEQVISSADAVILQLEIPIDTVCRALAIARKHGDKTILNPAPIRDLPETLLASVDLLVANEVEASCLCGQTVADPESAVVAAERIVELGVGSAVVTLGSQGAVYVGTEGKFASNALKVNAIDTTGAGDSFLGAFAVKWINGVDMLSALRYGCAVGSIAASRPGAQSSFPNMQEMSELDLRSLYHS